MKTIFKLLPFLLITAFVTSCSNDDDAPEPVNEEEVITTLTATFVPQGGGDTVVLKSQDLDGDGPNAPVISVSGPFAAGTTYNGSIELLNELESPAEDITVEVEEENLDHQFFYTPSSSLDITTAYENFDTDGNPLGTEFSLTANTVSSGTLTFTLRHLPNKPNTGLGDAGGETDVEATFSVSVQ